MQRITKTSLDDDSSVDVVELPGREGTLLVLARRPRVVDRDGELRRNGLDIRFTAALELAEADVLADYLLATHAHAGHRFELRLACGAFLTVTPQGQAFELELADIGLIGIHANCLVRAELSRRVGRALKRRAQDLPPGDEEPTDPGQPPTKVSG